MIVRWEPQFFAHFQWTADPPVLNDLDTYFLIDLPDGTRSTPHEFNAGETIQLSDTFGSKNTNDYLQVTGDYHNETTRLEISAVNGSTIDLDETMIVELPEFGSTIIKTANPAVDNRNTYVWVMAHQ